LDAVGVVQSRVAVQHNQFAVCQPVEFNVVGLQSQVVVRALQPKYFDIEAIVVGPLDLQNFQFDCIGVSSIFER